MQSPRPIASTIWQGHRVLTVIRQKTCTLDSLEAMQRMSFEHKTHAVLLRAGFDTTKLTLDSRKPGKISVRGIVETLDHKERLETLLKDIDPVQEIDAQVVVMAVPFH